MPTENFSDATARIALVTGGSRGLDRHTVLGLAKRGVRSIFTYHSNRAAADEVVAEVGASGVTAVALPLLKRSAAGRVVNVSSGLGSLTQNSDPGYEYAKIKVVSYHSSKAALNMQTILFAAELAAEGSPIKVNSADPGYTATDLNNHSGPRSVEEGARAAVRLATLPADGPTGGFFDENGPVPW